MMKAVLVMRWLLVLVALTTTAQAEPLQKFYNANGRTTGTATTNHNGVTVFRDAKGQRTGTACPAGPYNDLLQQQWAAYRYGHAAMKGRSGVAVLPLGRPAPFGLLSVLVGFDLPISGKLERSP